MQRKTNQFSVKNCFFLVIFFSHLAHCQPESLHHEENDQLPVAADKSNSLVFLAVIARNAAHLLPDYLGFIENLNYPKGNIAVQ